MRFELVERFRLELQRQPFPRLTEAEAGDMARRGAEAAASLACENMALTPEQEALFSMLLEERVPPAERAAIVRRFLSERYTAKGVG